MLDMLITERPSTYWSSNGERDLLCPMRSTGTSTMSEKRSTGARDRSAQPYARTSVTGARTPHEAHAEGADEALKHRGVEAVVIEDVLQLG